jgi:pimeloyl-ACP methyl ester carboxylesterase
MASSTVAALPSEWDLCRALAERGVATSRFDELREDRLPEAVKRLRRALLIMHAPGDEVVGIDSAARIFQAALHPKSFVSLADADHLLSREEDARYAADVLAAWAARYLRSDAQHGLGAMGGEAVAGFRSYVRAPRPS